VAVLTISPAELAAAGTPLAKVVESAGPYAIIFLTIVSVLTGINGALVQIIMASRVLYGLGKDNKNIEIFSHVNKKTQTPIEATLFASIIVLILALFFPLRDLAEMTSTIILVLFVLLNLALLKLKKDKRKYPKGTSIYPFWLPVL
jgi:amino acid transporter